MAPNTTSIQTTYGYDRELAISGALADNGPHYAPPGIAAAEDLQSGKACAWANVAKTTVRQFKRNLLTWTMSAALGASNRLQGTITTTDMLGNVITVPIDETYATSAAATYAAIIADATAGDADITGVVTGDSIAFSVAGNKYMTVTIAPAVTGGSAVTVTSAYSSNDGAVGSFAGIVGYERGMVPSGTGTIRFAAGDPVTVWRQGRVWAVTDETLAAGATPLFRITAGTSDNQEVGTPLAAAGSPVVGIALTNAPIRVAQGALADGLVKFELNLP